MTEKVWTHLLIACRRPQHCNKIIQSEQNSNSICNLSWWNYLANIKPISLSLTKKSATKWLPKQIFGDKNHNFAQNQKTEKKFKLDLHLVTVKLYTKYQISMTKKRCKKTQITCANFQGPKTSTSTVHKNQPGSKIKNQTWSNWSWLNYI